MAKLKNLALACLALWLGACSVSMPLGTGGSGTGREAAYTSKSPNPCDDRPSSLQCQDFRAWNAGGP
jgi:hypothetical protein